MTRWREDWTDTETFNLANILYLKLPRFWQADRFEADWWRFAEDHIPEAENWGDVCVKLETIDDYDDVIAAHAAMFAGEMAGWTGRKIINAPDAPDHDPDAFVQFCVFRLTPLPNGIGAVGMLLRIWPRLVDKPAFKRLRQQMDAAFFDAWCAVGPLVPSLDQAESRKGYLPPPNASGKRGALPRDYADMAERDIGGRVTLRMPKSWTFDAEGSDPDFFCFYHPGLEAGEDWGTFWVSFDVVGAVPMASQAATKAAVEGMTDRDVDGVEFSDLMTIEQPPEPSDVYDDRLLWADSFHRISWRRMVFGPQGFGMVSFIIGVQAALLERPEYQALVDAMAKAAEDAAIYGFMDQGAPDGRTPH